MFSQQVMPTAIENDNRVNRSQVSEKNTQQLHEKNVDLISSASVQPKMTVDILQSKDEQEKKIMLEMMERETKKFQQALADYHALRLPNKAAYLKVSSMLVQSIDQVIQAGDWQKTLFLRNTIKPLMAVREQALVVQKKLTQEQIQGPAKKQLGEDQIKVFITIYQSQGHNLALWETQLRSLSSYVQGRPVYSNEEDIRRALRAKLDQVNEAYVVVAIDRTSVMNLINHAERTDRLGHKLLVLMPGALQSENIYEFVHQGKCYDFIENQLYLASS
ncbi:MAG: Dot/Icm secretion system protein IcmQ [Gammaproteobacteria bacterium RIFCSPHIGHO2_12_FULL_41_15]|nr:MAG: Dot/Icm secretion system protein IcmQ [Gammaproteobacteria bacterium RIFCSPHIGHO2_12_FULL_41_15]